MHQRADLSTGRGELLAEMTADKPTGARHQHLFSMPIHATFLQRGRVCVGDSRCRESWFRLETQSKRIRIDHRIGIPGARRWVPDPHAERSQYFDKLAACNPLGAQCHTRREFEHSQCCAYRMGA